MITQVGKVARERNKGKITKFSPPERTPSIQELSEDYPDIPTEIYDIEQSHEIAMMWQEAFGIGEPVYDDEGYDGDDEDLWEAYNVSLYDDLWEDNCKLIGDNYITGSISTDKKFVGLFSITASQDDLTCFAKQEFGKDFTILEYKDRELLIKIREKGLPYADQNTGTE